MLKVSSMSIPEVVLFGTLGSGWRPAPGGSSLFLGLASLL
jgi:hypothetical protein